MTCGKVGAFFFLQVHQSWDILSWILLYGHVNVPFYNRLKISNHEQDVTLEKQKNWLTQNSTDFTVPCPLTIKVSYFENKLFGYPWWRTWRAATNCMVHTNARQEPSGKLCRIVSRKCIVSILMSTNTYSIWIPPVWSMGTEIPKDMIIHIIPFIIKMVLS